MACWLARSQARVRSVAAVHIGCWWFSRKAQGIPLPIHPEPLRSDLLRPEPIQIVLRGRGFGQLPIVFSPIGVINYSNTCNAHGASWEKNGPPSWIDRYRNEYDVSPSDRPPQVPRSNGLLELRAARNAGD